MGKIYGKQWRDWNGIDQIQNLITNLRNNPDSRRLMVSAWNVMDVKSMKLPPCHYGFQLYTRKMSLDERINYYNKYMVIPFNRSSDYLSYQLDEMSIPKRKVSLMWQQRSVDVPLGLPFNIASYALLLKIISNEVNMVPDELIGNLGDTHIYKNQIDGINEQLSREPFKLPKVELNYRLGDYSRNLKDLTYNQFNLLKYKSHPKINIPLSN
jgi:thymidylate synthase